MALMGKTMNPTDLVFLAGQAASLLPRVEPRRLLEEHICEAQRVHVAPEPCGTEH